MECGILQWQQKIIKSITVLRFCKLEHLATQHNFSGHHQSSHNLLLYSASYWPVAVKNPARRGENDHHRQTAPMTDTNQHCRCVADDMTKCIQISRVMYADVTHSTKVKAESQWAKYPNPCVRASSMRVEQKIAIILWCYSLNKKNWTSCHISPKQINCNFLLMRQIGQICPTLE
jgi:hypothetical protein